VSEAIAVPPALVAAIEQANVNAFPSERLLLDGSWLMRLSPGNPARRVNSLNIHDPRDSDDLAARLARAEAVFAENGVAFHLRVTPLTPPQVTEFADGQGWLRTGETGVWSRALEQTLPEATGSGPPLTLAWTGLGEWLDAFARTGGTRAEAVTPQALASLGQALGRVAAPRLCLVAQGTQGEPLGVLIAIVDGPLVGLYDVAVAPAARRRGLGRLLVRAALARAMSLGARTAWLQVTAENHAARALYAGLGFREAFGYHYRRPA
jgi:GNAT superfamily N-acetyltransferase